MPAAGSDVVTGPSPRLRRAQALLGTVVVIDVAAPPERAEAALAAALQRVAGIHAAMSFHEAGSDLGRIARARPGDALQIAADTHTVLALALQLEAESGGAFNACCAAALVERGLLPAPPDAPAAGARTLAEAIELLEGNRLHIRKPAWIDLGGIAKGHAVDAAVAVLQAAGIDSGVVNAGGDLRCFGPEPFTVRVRDPREPALSLPLACITDMACATTAWSLAQPQRRAAHVVGPEGAVADNPPMSLTVFAPRCALADALTKVVWLRGRDATGLLHKHGANAFVWRENGEQEHL